MPFQPVSRDLITPATRTGLQADPSSAVLRNGEVVIVWDSASGDGNGDAVMGRLFRPNTGALGFEFRLNSTIENTQADPVVAALSNGRFVAAWVSMDTGDGSGYCIRARIFEPSGIAVGDDFIVNSSTLDNQVEPSITALADGRFAIAFTAAGGSGDGDSDAVRIRVFDSNGIALGPDSVPVTTTAGPQGQPALATLTDGRMVMIYGSAPFEGQTADFDVRGVLMDANGNRLGPDFAVGTTTAEAQGYSNVIALAGGGFFASWYSNDFDGGSGSSVRGRFFGSNGTPLGSDFLLNSTRTGDQVGPSAAQLDDGRVVVTWWSTDTGDRSGSCIRARVFDQNGVPEDADFIVNSTTINNQAWPTVTALPGTGFMISWTTADTGDGSLGTVRTRVYEPIGLTLSGTSGNDTLTGSAFSDAISGSSGDDAINGLGGNDSLSGGAGSDTLNGGDGNDYLAGDGGNDRLFGGAGADILSGFDDDDHIEGGEGNDSLNGGLGNDRLIGGAGDDFYNGNAGADVFVYSEGIDRISDFSTMAAGERIDLTAISTLVSFRQLQALATTTANAATLLTFSAGNTLELTNVTRVALQPYHFTFIVAPGNDVLGVESRNDTLWGTVWSEGIYGFSGDDELRGAGGDDILDGGAGNDTIHFDPADTWSGVTGGTGIDTLVITGGTAPTHLDLVAQGFERVRHQYFDVTNTQSWTSSIDIYDQQWQLLSYARQFDDGTFVNFTQGFASDLFFQRVESFVQRTVTEQDRISQQTYNNDGSRNAYYWDAPGVQNWRELSEDYNSAGERTVQRIYNDDNSYRFFYWDPTGNQNWANFDEEFDAGGARHTQRIVYDRGNTRNYYWDIANSQSWTTFDEEYAMDGSRFVQRIQYDDGTSSQQFWDTGNNQNYSSYVDYADVTGQRIEQRIFLDQGPNAGGYMRTFYDPANAHAWSSIEEIYNAAGTRVSQIITPD